VELVASLEERGWCSLSEQVRMHNNVEFDRESGFLCCLFLQSYSCISSLSRARPQSDGNNSRRGKKRVFCFSTRFKKVFKLVHREQRGVLLKERNQKEERERKKRVLFDSIHERGERRDGR